MNSGRIIEKVSFEITKYNSHLIELAEALFGQGDAWEIFRKSILRRGNDLRRDIGEYIGHVENGSGTGVEGAENGIRSTGKSILK